MTAAPRQGAPPGTRSGPGRSSGTSQGTDASIASTNVSDANVTQLATDGLRLARGSAFPPSARRRRWVVIVTRCPHCGGHHLHFGTPSDPPRGARAAGCRGRYFLVSRAPRQVGGR